MFSDLFPGWQVANEIVKPQLPTSFHKLEQLINWLQKNCNRKWNFSTGYRK